MGLLDPFRRFFRRMAESDELRYAEEIRAWAESVPGSVRIAEASPRSRVKLAGVVRRITVRPLEGHESLEAILSDGTGEVTVVWMVVGRSVDSASAPASSSRASSPSSVARTGW